jgi:hypothetical protein
MTTPEHQMKLSKTPRRKKPLVAVRIRRPMRTITLADIRLMQDDHHLSYRDVSRILWETNAQLHEACFRHEIVLDVARGIAALPATRRVVVSSGMGCRWIVEVQA